MRYLWAPEEYLKNCARLSPRRDSVGTREEIPLTSSATVLNILPFFSRLSTLFHTYNTPPPPHLPPPLLIQPWLLCYVFFLFVFFVSLFFLFFFPPGSNEEKIWEQGLPICAGEWRSSVWVSTLLFPGTSRKPLIHKESLRSPSGLRTDVSVTDVSQADPLLGHCLFVSHMKWACVLRQHNSDYYVVIWCFLCQLFPLWSCLRIWNVIYFNRSCVVCLTDVTDLWIGQSAIVTLMRAVWEAV